MAVLIKRAIVIANPASRRGRRLARHAMEALASRSVDCTLVLTERPGHAAELATRHAPEYDALFVLGGDGTVMEVASALAEQRIDARVGVLAGGTGNLVARALGIPLSIAKAVPALIDGDELVIDLGRLTGGAVPARRFAIAAGVGIDAAMIAETPGWLKRRLGVLAYTIMGSRAALRAVFRREFFHTRVTVDGAVHERRAAAVMIANFGAVLGDRITLGPGILTDDGLLDACIFSPGTVRDAVRIIWRMLRRDFGSDPCMLYVPGRTIEVETTPSLSWQADGELMGSTPVAAVVEPLALRLLVPHRRQ
ncbi:MAG TPA: diacylglycerol kinase family protein [Gemmatimonadaceae bacterium]|nr:diacylglycerol kinase family protein [Gemmatimonadaceae bacterium]